jgi:hypothetical protein
MKKQKYKANMNYGERMTYARYCEHCYKYNIPLKISIKEKCLYIMGYIVFLVVLLMLFFWRS